MKRAVTGRPAKQQRRVDERPGEEVRGHFNVRDLDLPGGRSALECTAEEAEPVLQIQGPPFVPAEDCRSIQQKDAPETRLGAGLEKGVHSQLKRLEGRPCAPALCAQTRVNLLHEPSHHLAEQARLAVLEVMVERPAGHAGHRDDLLGGDLVEAPPLEQSPRSVQKGLPRRLRGQL